MKLPADIATAMRAYDAACAVAGRELDFNDPILDGTDAAHPAWWRGHNRASEVWRERVATAERDRDAALADAAALRAAAGEYLAARDAWEATLDPYDVAQVCQSAETCALDGAFNTADATLRAAIGGAT